jgi:hypothetical protein
MPLVMPALQSSDGDVPLWLTLIPGALLLRNRGTVTCG